MRSLRYANHFHVLQDPTQEDLLADWNLAANGKTPFPIKGLDQ